jgi:hypothetical protein
MIYGLIFQGFRNLLAKLGTGGYISINYLVVLCVWVLGWDLSLPQY